MLRLTPRSSRLRCSWSETPFLELHAARASAAGGLGGLVLVSGDAGLGKTTLVRRFAAQVVEKDRSRLALDISRDRE